MSLEQKITEAWYGDKKWVRLLSPLSAMYRFGLERKRSKSKSLLESQQADKKGISKPILVVGNITVGGTGKTPLIIFLCHLLEEKGLRVGVVSRGYGGNCQTFPHEVTLDDSVALVGDEPMLIATQTKARVVIDPDRFAAACYLDKSHQAKNSGVDIILSDDGMQHFGLPRDAEIVVVDGARELGNERLLPSGPLRESVQKLCSVELCLLNGPQEIEDLKSSVLRASVSGSFQLVPSHWVRVSNCEKVPLDQLPHSEDRLAVVGIGNPERFISTLGTLGVNARLVALDDHQPISQSMLTEFDAQNSKKQILMTMKDAVKCQLIATNNCWALDVRVQVAEQTERQITELLSSLTKVSV